MSDLHILPTSHVKKTPKSVTSHLKIAHLSYNGYGHTNQSFVLPWPRFKITMFCLQLERARNMHTVTVFLLISGNSVTLDRTTFPNAALLYKGAAPAIATQDNNTALVTSH